jgi:hypothetical protein
MNCYPTNAALGRPCRITASRCNVCRCLSRVQAAIVVTLRVPCHSGPASHPMSECLSDLAPLPVSTPLVLQALSTSNTYSSTAPKPSQATGIKSPVSTALQPDDSSRSDLLADRLRQENKVGSQLATHKGVQRRQWAPMLISHMLSMMQGASDWVCIASLVINPAQSQIK